MSLSLGGRSRAVFISLAALALASATMVPAMAATSGPPAPIDLSNGNQACSTDPSAPVYLFVFGFTGLDLHALSPGTGVPPLVTQQYQVWPVSDPAQTLTFANESVIPGYEYSISVPGSDLADGQTYAWDVQTVTASGTSPWSATCYFTVDDTRPASPPTVTSPNYLPGQVNQGGTPVQLTFGANGVSDVAGYVFSWSNLPVAVGNDPYTTDPSHFVAASTLGGSATVSSIPSGGGPLTLTVASLDRALNESPPTTFEIFVKPNAPTVTQLNPNIQFGDQAQFHVTADPGLEAASPVVSYTVNVQDSIAFQNFTVHASADGTAEFALTINDPTGYIMTVTSTSADGWTSQNFDQFDGADTWPTVSSDVYPEWQFSGGAGIPGTFTFAAPVKGIKSYTYAFSDGTGGTVAANGTGEAQITWTPSQSGPYFLDVYGTTKDGIQLTDYFYNFFVN